jgi:hypothetical protein
VSMRFARDVKNRARVDGLQPAACPPSSEMALSCISPPCPATPIAATPAEAAGDTSRRSSAAPSLPLSIGHISKSPGNLWSRLAATSVPPSRKSSTAPPRNPAESAPEPVCRPPRFSGGSEMCPMDSLSPGKDTQHHPGLSGAISSYLVPPGAGDLGHTRPMLPGHMQGTGRFKRHSDQRVVVVEAPEIEPRMG